MASNFRNRVMAFFSAVRVFTRCRNDDRITFPEELKDRGMPNGEILRLKSVGFPVGRRPLVPAMLQALGQAPLS
jgi:hypothetical protein